jgi:hypothetical protein
MEGGLSVAEAIPLIMAGFVQGTDEIEAAVEGEIQMLKMKREDPVAVFRALEQSAEQELYSP